MKLPIARSQQTQISFSFLQDQMDDNRTELKSLWKLFDLPGSDLNGPDDTVFGYDGRHGNGEQLFHCGAGRWGADQCRAPSLSALTAAMIASSMVVAEYSRRVSILSPIFIFFSLILSRTGRAAMMAMKFPSEPSSLRMVFTIKRKV